VFFKYEREKLKKLGEAFFLFPSLISLSYCAVLVPVDSGKLGVGVESLV